MVSIVLIVLGISGVLGDLCQASSEEDRRKVQMTVSGRMGEVRSEVTESDDSARVSSTGRYKKELY